jgi:hypothetical protein
VHASERDVPTVTARRPRLLGGLRPSHCSRIAIQWPALEQRQSSQVNFMLSSQTDHFLTYTAAYGLRRHLQQWEQLPPLGDQVTHSARWLHLRQGRNTRSKSVKTSIATPQRMLNSVIGPEQINCHGEITPFDILKKNGPTAKRGHIRVKLMGSLALVLRYPRRLGHGPRRNL